MSSPARNRRLGGGKVKDSTMMNNETVKRKVLKDSLTVINSTRSSSIKSLFYDSNSNKLFVEFQPGALYYQYNDVPKNIIQRFQQPDISFGSEINEMKNKFSFQKLDKFPWMSNNDCTRLACELFFSYLSKIDEDILIQCEIKNYLNSFFSLWKKKNPQIRSSLKLILNQLLSQGKLYILSKTYYIFITKSDRKKKRIEEINKSCDNNSTSIDLNREIIEKNSASLDIIDVCFNKQHDDNSDITTPLNEYNYRTITIINSCEHYRNLINIYILKVKGLKLDISSIAFPVIIHPHSSTRLTIGVKCSNVGSISSIMTFSFGSFTISRLFLLRCGDNGISELLKPVADYRRVKKHIKEGIDKENVKIMDGERPNTGL